MSTTSVAEVSINPVLRYDPAYFRSKHGIVKIICIVFNILGFICIEFSGLHSHSSSGEYFITISMIALCLTSFLLVLYTFHFCEKFHQIDWLKSEMYYCIIVTILYTIAACVASTYPVEAFTAAAFFGFCAACFYGFDVFLKCRSLQLGEVAQGTVVFKNQTAFTIPLN